MFPCASKSFFNIDCPICGFQRSLVFLLQGDFKKSFVMYPPLIPVCILIVFFLIHLYNKQVATRKRLNYLSVVVLAIITVNYITKMVFLKAV